MQTINTAPITHRQAPNHPSRPSRPSLALLAAWITSVALTGCGGDPHHASASPAPSPSATPATPAPPPASPAPPPSGPAAPTGLAVAYMPKGFTVSWNAVAGATSYQLEFDPDGPGPAAPITSSAGTATTADVKDVPLHFSLNATFAVRTCVGTTCGTASTPLAPDINQAIGYFKASNTRPGGSFGHAVALSADGVYLAVSGQRENSGATGVNGNQADTSADEAGAVYVFRRTAGVWSQQAYLKASNTRATSFFGQSLAISQDGSTLAVGAMRESSAATGVNGNQGDTNAPDAGAAYVFVRAGTTWTQQAYLKASNTEAQDRFGAVLALSADGNTLAVSAYDEDSNATGIGGDQGNNLSVGAGAVYAFVRSGTTWTQQAYIKASNTSNAQRFGVGLALSGNGNLLAIGAPGEASSATGVGGNQADQSALFSGAVYTFLRSGSTWTQQAYIKASNTRATARFGSAVALSSDGSTLAVGALGDSSGATGIDGNGADTSATDAGAVYVFRSAAGSWQQEAYVKATNTQPDYLFGETVALSATGDMLLVGATGEGSNGRGMTADPTNTSALYSGAAYTYVRSSGTWFPHRFLKASNSRTGLNFGLALSLSGDGQTIAVGTTVDQSHATGIQGDQTSSLMVLAGAVYLY